MAKRGHKYNPNCTCSQCELEGMRRSAAFGNGGGSGWRTQSHNNNATVQVSGGYNRRTHGYFDPDGQRTDFEIFDKTGPNGVEKTHLSIDTDGNKTVWNGNKKFGS